MLRRRDREKEMQREARRLVDTYGNLVMRLAYTYLGSRQDAEDVSQDVLCKLITRRTPFNSPEHEKAWTIRCTSNACKDILRSAARTRNVALEAAGEVRDTSQEATEDETPGLVTRAVMELPPLYREVIYLHYYEDMSIKEIAGSIGESECAVAKRLSRARAELRSKLEGENDEQHADEVSRRDVRRHTVPREAGSDDAGDRLRCAECRGQGA